MGAIIYADQKDRTETLISGNNNKNAAA